MSFTNLDLVNLCNPETGGSGSGSLASGWAHVQRFMRCHVTVTLESGADNVTLSTFQAQDKYGLGAKPLRIHSVYTKFETEDEFTNVRVDANDYSVSRALGGVVVIGFDVSTLDVNNGFQFVQVKTSGSTTRQHAIMIYPTGGQVVRIVPHSVIPRPVAGWTGLADCA